MARRYRKLPTKLLAASLLPPLCVIDMLTISLSGTAPKIRASFTDMLEGNSQYGSIRHAQSPAPRHQISRVPPPSSPISSSPSITKDPAYALPALTSSALSCSSRHLAPRPTRLTRLTPSSNRKRDQAAQTATSRRGHIVSIPPRSPKPSQQPVRWTLDFFHCIDRNRRRRCTGGQCGPMSMVQFAGKMESRSERVRKVLSA